MHQAEIMIPQSIAYQENVFQSAHQLFLVLDWNETNDSRADHEIHSSSHLNNLPAFAYVNTSRLSNHFFNAFTFMDMPAKVKRWFELFDCFFDRSTARKERHLFGQAVF